MIYTIQWPGRDVDVQCSTDQSASPMRGNCRFSETIVTSITGPEKLRVFISFKIDPENKTGTCILNARLLGKSVKVEETRAVLSPQFFIHARNKLLRAMLDNIQQELTQLETTIMIADLDDQLLVGRQPAPAAMHMQTEIPGMHAMSAIQSSRQSYLPDNFRVSMHGYLPSPAPQPKPQHNGTAIKVQHFPAPGSYLPAIKPSFSRNGYLGNGYEYNGNGNGHGNGTVQPLAPKVAALSPSHAIQDIAYRMLQLKDAFRAIERTIE